MSEMPAPDAHDPDFEQRLAAFRQRLVENFNQVPFIRHIGARVVRVDNEAVVAELDMQPVLVGNVFMQILHGGVIASLLDSVGGLASMHAVYQRLQGRPKEEKMKRMAQLGTIDMRIDYIRPGRGQRFVATGKVVRLGSKICAVQMTLHNDDDALIATANAVFHY